MLLWNLERSDRQVGREFAYRGDGGARIERSSHRRSDAVLTHLHRILIEPLTELSVIGMVRATVGQGPLRGKADVTVQLSWYADTNGPSVAQATVPLQIASDGEWQPFRVDVTAPPVARAVGVFLRLTPPERGTATADFDDLRIVEWAPRDARFSPQYDHFLVTGSGRATVSKAHLPGAERWPMSPPRR